MGKDELELKIENVKYRKSNSDFKLIRDEKKREELLNLISDKIFTMRAGDYEGKAYFEIIYPDLDLKKYAYLAVNHTIVRGKISIYLSYVKPNGRISIKI